MKKRTPYLVLAGALILNLGAFTPSFAAENKASS